MSAARWCTCAPKPARTRVSAERLCTHHHHPLSRTCTRLCRADLQEREFRGDTFTGEGEVSPGEDEYLCPVCRRLGNTLLPLPEQLTPEQLLPAGDVSLSTEELLRQNKEAGPDGQPDRSARVLAELDALERAQSAPRCPDPSAAASSPQKSTAAGCEQHPEEQSPQLGSQAAAAPALHPESLAQAACSAMGLAEPQTHPSGAAFAATSAQDHYCTACLQTSQAACLPSIGSTQAPGTAKTQWPHAGLQSRRSAAAATQEGHLLQALGPACAGVARTFLRQCALQAYSPAAAATLLGSFAMLQPSQQADSPSHDQPPEAPAAAGGSSSPGSSSGADLSDEQLTSGDIFDGVTGQLEEVSSPRMLPAAPQPVQQQGSQDASQLLQQLPAHVREATEAVVQSVQAARRATLAANHAQEVGQQAQLAQHAATLAGVSCPDRQRHALPEWAAAKSPLGNCSHLAMLVALISPLSCSTASPTRCSEM